MALVEEMMNDISTFLYAQGRQHILQECGDMVKAERWARHSNMWCRAIDDMDESKMDCYKLS
jgi:hypothetical protein